MYLYGNWSVGRKVSDIFIFELAHKYSPHENVLSELPSPSSFDVFAGRKEGRKEGGGGGKEGRKEGKKKGRKEKRKEGKKKGRKEKRKEGRKDGEYQILCHINTLHHDISTRIHHTVFFTFPKVLTKMICLTIKSLFGW